MTQLNIEKIPEELKELNQWVLWKLEKVKGKTTKVPYTDINKKAITTKYDTWLSFDEAIKKYNTNNFSGIGFVFTSKDDYVGIDIDKCVNDGVIDEKIKAIIERCNTYAELSQSEKGIHIITKGKLLRAVKKEIEMYSNSRYFTFTGNSINDNAITSNQDLIDELYKMYSNDDNKVIEMSEFGEEFSDDVITDLLEQSFVSDNGFKIKALYEGEWQGIFNSQSEADQSLCNYLAFWLDKNYVNVNKAFMKSGLYRQKWEREDYRNETIKRAINSCKESYQDLQKNNENSYIWEYKNRYYKKCRDTDTQISNFVIQPMRYIECIDDPRLSILETLITTDKDEKIYKTYRVNDFDNIPTFDKVTGSFATAFNGTPRDLKTIKLLVYGKIKNKIKAYSYGGMHYINSKWCFIDDLGCIDGYNNINKEIILLEKSTFNNTISQVTPINKEQLIELSSSLFRFNSSRIVFSILGYISAIFIKKKLNDVGIKFSHLFYSGEAGAGKSETLRIIVKQILCISNSNINAGSCTKFALEKILNSNNTIPIIIDEYKPITLTSKQINLISNIARNTYDENLGIRGNERLELEFNSLKGSFILVGEASTDETAVIERSLLLTFSKKESYKSSEFFKGLSDKKELLNSLGKSLLLIALRIEPEELKSIYDFNYKLIKDDIKADRVRSTGALTLTGISLLKKVYEQLELNFEEVSGFNHNDIVEILSDNLKTENLEGGNCTKSEIDKTIECINDMFTISTYTNSSDWSYAKILHDEFENRDILCIRLRELYIQFSKYIKDYNLEKSNERKFLDWGSFQKQLQKTNYYIEHNKPTRFSGKGINLTDKVMKCFNLDLTTMKKLNINVDNIIEYVNKFCNQN